MSVMPLTNGLAFLEKTPNAFECRQVSSQKMSDLVSDHKPSWKSCTAKEICALNLAQKDYRAIKTDPEYLDNWVPKLDMLCKPQSEIGLLGSFFFLGAMMSIFWIPKYADKYGRKNIILAGLTVQVVTCIGFAYNKSLKGAAILMIILGMVHPTKNIVFFNYAVEVMPVMYKQLIINIVMTLDSIWIILLCISYQYIDVSWRFLQLTGIIWTVSVLVYCIRYLDESPRFYYNVKKFTEARDVLNKIAQYNSVKLENFTFDEEHLSNVASGSGIRSSNTDHKLMLDEEEKSSITL